MVVQVHHKAPYYLFVVGEFKPALLHVAIYQGCYSSVATGAFFTLPFGQSLSTDSPKPLELPGTPFASAPDQGDGLIMQGATNAVNRFCSDFFGSLQMTAQSFLSVPVVAVEPVGMSYKVLWGGHSGAYIVTLA
ncbi:hypothetical protein [Pseudomonas aegrilactucae]|uniref:Uncharacterized protein n=1 Tax=Pseudomonas aegrilactucae TaxID=2854028 RepID=A0A9Q2XIR8_9PSED|nr:hypothetical protein [Pseudomonas aegrilactucae]MBV6286904.1 hypothetical protein [Pseudomonas aegrilactucae]